MPPTLTLILSALLYAVIHSLTATLTAKARARQWLGPFAERWYRLTYNIFAGVSFLPIMWLMATLPDQTLYSIPLPWAIFTGVGQLIGILVIILGIWQADALDFIGLRQIFSPPSPHNRPELVISGLYQWVRHPLYTGGLLFIWLTPIMTRNSLTLAIILSMYLVVGAHFEERRLRHEFGEAYATYQKQVSILLPRFRKKE
ncbi:MAG: isoprenylcysteine carboxylmethyltransferase family protein [Anaerolineae bacterium]|nr:isoprenylcysteine carboxylmethyltransferase family protein [Anaerolineae bacterium]MBL6965200.1 isoprenylcysteine carboxylmethyltransferase family protein [Anaerolineales bacterium]